MRIALATWLSLAPLQAAAGDVRRIEADEAADARPAPVNQDGTGAVLVLLEPR
jgi:hypothetical protein